MRENNINIGFALCGSFCTFRKAIDKMKELKGEGFNIFPIMSNTASLTDTRFGKASDFIDEIEAICGKRVMTTIVETEPIGPKEMLDVLVICPCTGNTLAKLNNAITDTSVTMAAKSHLRIGRPVIIAPATNDGLGASAQNIGRLVNTRNIYFVPFCRDDPHKKPNSLVAKFDMLLPTLRNVLDGKAQYQPIVS